ncbi:MAG TPA: hypothetical protein VLC91_16715 [Spongiibacteraceae bacterium]|nr:hypothetical protein [Spongiibacteraceae bacterium]
MKLAQRTNNKHAFKSLATPVIASLFCIGISSQSHATVYYGEMIGSITSAIPSFVPPPWEPVSIPAVGTVLDVKFVIYDSVYTITGLDANHQPAGGYLPWALSGDPAHNGQYVDNYASASAGINVTSILMGGTKSFISSSASSQIDYNTINVLNDTSGKDGFSMSTTYPTIFSGPGSYNNNALISSLTFSLTTLQNILASGAPQQEFYWLRSLDSNPDTVATGVMSEKNGFDPVTYYFNIDQLSLSVSASPTVPTSAVPNNVPVPATAWLFGSGLMGLASAARKRKAA